MSLLVAGGRESGKAVVDKRKFHKKTSFTRMVPEGNSARGFEKFTRIGFLIVLVVNLILVILLRCGVFSHAKNGGRVLSGDQGASVKTGNGTVADSKP